MLQQKNNNITKKIIDFGKISPISWISVYFLSWINHKIKYRNFCINHKFRYLISTTIMNIMKKFRLVFKTSTIIFLTNFRYPFNSPINSPIFLQKSEPFFPPGHHLIFICLFYTVYYDRHRICCHLSIFCGKQTISAAFHRKFLRQIALIQQIECMIDFCRIFFGR